MNIVQIENNVQKLVNSYSKETFIYDLLLAYGLPKASITRLKKGNLNLSKVDGVISWKKKVFFKEVFEQDLHITISTLADGIDHEERFVIITDYKTLLAIDTKTQDKLDIELKDLPKHYDFFLPWAGMEKAQFQDENPADVKAAEKMAKLFDEIKKDNPDNSPEFIHGLNVFLCRLLFCSFAEDTNIFKKNQFTNAIASHTQADGSDLSSYLSKFFEVLNTPEKDRQNLPAYINDFPYVNGGLFREKIQVPIFTRRSRQAIIDNGELDWSIINPDIFGSMMQAVMTPEHRGDLGIHYTSMPNIMKVIEPLFLNDLKEAFEKSKGSQKKRNELLKRLRTIKIFDPACGSGNFLITAYKELRRLEMRIFKESDSNLFVSSISLEQFYGIELDDFAHEIAKLSLWLAEHQMNAEFLKEFGCTNPTLPLKETGNIVQGNACRIDWETVCPKKEGDETYILGNPPYLGARLLDCDQKKDMELVFKNNVPGYNDLDYISCWFYKASRYLQSINAKSAFVSTNSICQGSQVSMLWPYIISSLEIFFAHKSFKWTNNAKNKAAVICVIVGLRNFSNQEKFIYSGSFTHRVTNISPYLLDSQNTIVVGRNKPLSTLPEMSFGSMPNDGGNLILHSDEEYNSAISSNPEIKSYLRVMYGGQDFLNGVKRYCFWISDDDLEAVNKIEFISKRIKLVKEYRETSKREATKKLAKIPHRFGEIRHHETDLIVVPATSSKNRKYIPIGFLPKGTIVNNSIQAIYSSELYLLGILSSKIHMAWVKTVAGRLKKDYRYSTQLCYNTFPFPPISDQRKQEITQCVLRILEEREKNPEKTLAQLYDPGKMPAGLLEAHRLNDLAVERCYRSKVFESDEERLEYLFMLYEKMNAEEQEKNTLREKNNKSIKGE